MTAAWRNSRCECPEATCTGTVCVDLAAPCGSTHDDSYTITVYEAGTTTVVGSATTNSSGVACVAIPESPESEWPRLVDVVATKTGCKTLTWAGRSVPCDGTLNLAGDAQCSTNSFAYTIQGCFNVPLPGATLTVSRTGYTASGTTDASGFVRVYGNGAGSTAGGDAYTVTISHPAGFATRVIGPLTSVTACGNVGATIQLLPDSDHVCCEVQKYFGSGNWSPYPIAKALTITDSGGAIAAEACGGEVCGARTMPEVGAQCGGVPYSCSDSSGSSFSPPAIASGTTAVRYQLALTAATPTLRQGHVFCSSILQAVYYSDVPPVCNPPNANKFRRAWRCAADCSTSSGSFTFFDAASVTVHSLHPFLATFTFVDSNDYGPNYVDPVTGVGSVSVGPHSLSVVVSE